jgi:hypothetical protein
MRNAIISDTDGSVEYQTVKLEPTNWLVSICTFFTAFELISKFSKGMACNAEGYQPAQRR